MAETYEQRMARLSRIHYLETDSDFSRTSVEEFETWKGQLGLPENEQTKWRVRRRFLDSYFQSLVDEYIQNKIGPVVLLDLLHKASTEKDYALLGSAMMKAFNDRPLPKSRYLGSPYLRTYAHFLKWLKSQWNQNLVGTALQNKIKSEIEGLIGKKLSGATLEKWLKPGSNSK